MRVHQVAKAQKDQGTCRCGHEIKAGEAYKWAKGRHTSRMVRCASCSFRQSDLTSGKMSGVYAAVESAEDTLAAWDGDDVEEVRGALEELATEVESVAEEYRDSANNIRDTFSESPTADECEEKADSLDSWKDDIESAASDLAEYEPEDEEPEEPDPPKKPAELAPEATDDERAAYAAALAAHEAAQEDHDTVYEAWETAKAAWDEAQEESKASWADEIRETASEVIGACPV